jgi:hypothetical protein
MPDFLIGIEIDKDYNPRGGSNIPEIEAEEIKKIRSGEWRAYGVGLLRKSTAGYFEPDYGTFLWGCVTDAGYDGAYADASEIQNAHLRGIAEEQVSEHEGPPPPPVKRRKLGTRE